MMIKEDNLNCPNSKVYGANMGPTWGRQDPGGPHVGPMNFASLAPTRQQIILSTNDNPVYTHHLF